MNIIHHDPKIDVKTFLKDIDEEIENKFKDLNESDLIDIIEYCKSYSEKYGACSRCNSIFSAKAKGVLIWQYNNFNFPDTKYAIVYEDGTGSFLFRTYLHFKYEIIFGLQTLRNNLKIKKPTYFY